MAIIYTYPRVINPDGTELIVVSETKNKNATRIMYVQDIWDHFDCSHCDFCTTSISKLTPSLGDSISATGCDYEVSLISSDGTVSIIGDALTDTIDFKVAESGCPTTYVVKPVSCDPDTSECTISNKSNTWIYTCDETLGALAPGYINNFKITGVEAYHPGAMLGETCWWIEEVSYSATAATCEECCCELDGVYSYLRCICEEGEWPAWSLGGTLIPEEIFLDPSGQVWGVCPTIDVKIGPDGEHWCYTKGDEVCDPAGVWNVQDSCVDCGQPRICECLPPTFTWEKCDDETQVTVASDAGAPPIGESVEYCCSDGIISVPECWKYLGNLGLPLSGALPECSVSPGELDCKCCENKCVWEYQACLPNTSSLPNTIYYDAGRNEASCECLDPYSNPVFSNGEETWCYTLEGESCEDPTDDVFYVTEAFCEDDEYCPPAGDPVYTFTRCDGSAAISTALSEITLFGATPITDYIDGSGCIFATLALAPGSETCWVITAGGINSGTPVTIASDPIDYSGFGDNCCECCLHPCNYQYDACDGAPLDAPPFVVVEIDAEDCAAAMPPGAVKIEYLPGEFWCYTTPVKSCTPITHAFTVFGDDCDLCTEYYRYWACADEDPEYYFTNNSLESTDITSLTFPAIISIGTEDDCGNLPCCISIEEWVDGGEAQTSIADYGCDTAYVEEKDCDCCENLNIAKYQACAESGDLCNTFGPYYIDTCLQWGTPLSLGAHPKYIQFEVNPGEFCCFEEVNNEPCEPAQDHPPINDNGGAGFADCNCAEEIFFQWRECGDDEWIDTETDLSAFVVGAGVWGTDEDECYEAREGGGGVGAPIDTSGWTTAYSPGPEPATACDCCEYKDVRTYVKCETSTLVDCDLMPNKVNLDNPTADPLLIVTDDINGWSCCYGISDVLPCDMYDTDYSFVVFPGTCVDLPPECIGVEEDKWIYRSCNECEDIVSTLPLHGPGELSFWWNCCFYEVPLATEPTLEGDNAPDVSELRFAGADCETYFTATGSNVQWQLCNVEPAAFIYTNCECQLPDGVAGYYVGLTVQGFSAPADSEGNPVTGNQCWHIVGPSAFPLTESLDCTLTGPFDCEEGTCL